MRRRIHWGLLCAAAIAGCASNGDTLVRELDPDADQRITQADEVAVSVRPEAGIDLGALNTDRLAQTIRSAILQRKAQTPSSHPPRRFELSLTITRYDGGKAAGYMTAGQTHIDGWRLLTNPDIIAFAHRYRDRVADRETFAWGRDYGGPAAITRIEHDFAAAITADLFNSE